MAFSGPQVGAVAIAAITMLSTVSAQDNWPQFRGPRAGVANDNPALPVRWTDANVAWKFDVPGFAWGSPIVWGDYVFVTTVISDEPRPSPDKDPNLVAQPHTGGATGQKPLPSPYRWVLYALDFKTGKPFAGSGSCTKAFRAPTKHSKNTWGSETPVTDGQRVYVYHAAAGLFAVDFNGRLVWSREVKLPESKGGAPTQVARTPGKDGGPRSLAASFFVGIGQAASPTLHEAASSLRPTTRRGSGSSPRSTRERAMSSGVWSSPRRSRLTGGRPLSSGRTDRAPRSSRPATTTFAPTTRTASCCGS